MTSTVSECVGKTVQKKKKKKKEDTDNNKQMMGEITHLCWISKTNLN